jgi:hypothetical protein
VLRINQRVLIFGGIIGNVAHPEKKIDRVLPVGPEKSRRTGTTTTKMNHRIVELSDSSGDDSRPISESRQIPIH